jgi:hypothetical protein
MTKACDGLSDVEPLRGAMRSAGEEGNLSDQVKAGLKVKRDGKSKSRMHNREKKLKKEKRHKEKKRRKKEKD